MTTFEAVNEVSDAKAARKRRQAFYTPLELVAKLVEWADVSEYTTCLEPSAGDGRIAHVMRRAGAVRVDCCEAEVAMHERITAAGGTVVGTDFTKYTGAKYDRIVMNPPFKGKQCQWHIEHAWTLLAPGGRLLSVAPTSVLNGLRDCEFDLPGCEHATAEELDGGLFKEFGTGIKVVVVELLATGAGDRSVEGFSNHSTFNAAVLIENDHGYWSEANKPGCDRSDIALRVRQEIADGGGSCYGIAWGEVWEHVSPGVKSTSTLEVEAYLSGARVGAA